MEASRPDARGEARRKKGPKALDSRPKLSGHEGNSPAPARIGMTNPGPVRAGAEPTMKEPPGFPLA